MKEAKQRGNTVLALKAGVWYVVSTFMIKAFSFITTPLFSRMMSKAHYGEFSNYASWQATLLIITGFELYNTVSRAYYDFRDDFDQYISSITVATGGFTCILYALFWVFRDWFLQVIEIREEYIHILFCTLLAMSCKSIFMARERTLYRYKLVSGISAISLIIPTVVAVISVLNVPMEFRLSARIYGFYGPYALIGLICAIALLYRGKVYRWHYFRYAFTLALPLLAQYLTAYLLTSTNNIITKNILGAEVAAIVSIASSAIHILTAFFQSISGAVTTWLMDNLKLNNYAKLRNQSTLYVALLAIVSLMVILLAPEVVWILGGTKYNDAVMLVPGMVLGVMIQSTMSLFTIILTYDKNVVKSAVFTGIVAVLSIAAKIWLLPVWGVAVLPHINVVAYLILFAINGLLIMKAGYKAVVPFMKYVALLLVVGVFTVISHYLYKHSIVRYGIIIALVTTIAFVAFHSRERVVKIFRYQKTKNK